MLLKTCLKVNKNNEYEFPNIPISSNRIQSVIYSYLTKRLINPKFPGSHNVAVPDILDKDMEHEIKKMKLLAKWNILFL